MLGHDILGTGATSVVVLNDWLADTSTWDPARPYLDRVQFTWAFADLRGYGRSRDLDGEHTLAEAAADVLALALARGWARFAVVGHSMSSLVALHLAQHAADRVDRAVLLTPPPPTGMGADDAILGYLERMALGDDATRLAGLRAQGGERLGAGWLAFKIARWRATADAAAVAGYARMFALDGVPEPERRVTIPVLAVTGEEDAPPMRSAAASAYLAPICDQLTVVGIADSGHYPMQETPPRLVALVERFLAAP
jgi:pimeloyl-ACP methyl ester carboxylesterase